MEREEDEGGLAGETFMDYVLSPTVILSFKFLAFEGSRLILINVSSLTQRPPKVSIGPPHPDPVVETSSLSAVQPPEPTYDLRIKDKLESSKALSCLQIETLVYACQVA